MDIKEKILELKERRRAVILAHNYQLPEVQDIADFVGDSLGLSREAREAEAGLIVFCGVDFMAETAKILNPSKRVLLPDKNAGCPMARMITAEQLRKEKEKYPAANVVCYVNSSADVKAESDYCCTSSNAVNVVKKVSTEEIIFVPDKYLGSYVKSQTKDERMILWNGYCPTHMAILPEHLKEQKQAHPEAKVMVHPECRREVIQLADTVQSTGGMLKYANQMNTSEFIVGTEIGLIHRLKKENKEKRFYPASKWAVCPNMKLINLEKIYWALEEMEYQIEIPDETIHRATAAIQRMVEIS